MIIEVKDNVIITEWWTSKEEEDGKKQITKETVYGKNKGRSNETTDNEQAILEYERKIRKKKKKDMLKIAKMQYWVKKLLLVQHCLNRSHHVNQLVN